jgi:LmbE family N-acetylglucosaminyl deacetylase
MNRFLPQRLERILCLGAHADDIEIGAGGTILRLLQEYPGATVHWVVFSAAGIREPEARLSANLFLEHAAARHVVVREFRDGFFPYEGAAIKQVFEALKDEVDPDLILTHASGDAHQDHRLVNELTWNTFRRHAIFEFEIPKFDGDLGRPNVYVPLSEGICKTKIEHLTAAFASQTNKHWFTEETFRAILRLRGVECGSPHAEAFFARKLII